MMKIDWELVKLLILTVAIIASVFVMLSYTIGETCPNGSMEVRDPYSGALKYCVRN